MVKDTGRNEHVRSLNRAMRSRYATNYPTYMVTADGAAICNKCAEAEFRTIYANQKDGLTASGWYVEGVDINYEDGDLMCDHCGEQIPAAYV